MWELTLFPLFIFFPSFYHDLFSITINWKFVPYVSVFLNIFRIIEICIHTSWWVFFFDNSTASILIFSLFVILSSVMEAVVLFGSNALVFPRKTLWIISGSIAYMGAISVDDRMNLKISNIKAQLFHPCNSFFFIFFTSSLK